MSIVDRDYFRDEGQKAVDTGCLRLNLGCGAKKIDGWLNVDLHGDPDLIVDLDETPWPWNTDSVERVIMNHILEHLGVGGPYRLIMVMQELYRVCAHGAAIEVVVPSPFHDDFVNDPTHVRPITPEMLALFSKEACAKFVEMGAANTPLALYHDVDFRLEFIEYVLDDRFRHIQPGVSLDRMMLTQRNVVREVKMLLRVVKESGDSRERNLEIKLDDGKFTVGR